MSISGKLSIASACAPAAVGAKAIPQNNRIWSLTQAGAGMAGSDARILSCVFDRQTDEHGNFRGEIPYPVIGEIQAHPPLTALLKSVEWRPVVTLDGKTGLLYRKLPSPGFSNSWLDSGEIAVQAWVDAWGRVTSDRHAGVYRFEALNLPGRPQPTFPDIDELIDGLLTDYVINRLDHPVLECLLKPAAAPASSSVAYPDASIDDEEDDNAIY